MIGGKCMDKKIKDPRTQFPDAKLKEQTQQYPGLQGKMNPVPDCGESTYKGAGKLEGRKALITGGDSGIGRAVAIAYAREGADVAINYLPSEEDDAQEVKSWIEKAGRKAVLLPGDLKDETFTRQLVHNAHKELGGLDTLVLNAGIQAAYSNIKQIPSQHLKDIFTVNIISMYWIVQEALDYLPAGGSIVTTTSIEAFSPSEPLVDYAATKAAIAAFSKGLSEQVASEGIRVNTVAPGPIWTALQISGGQITENIPTFGHGPTDLMGRAGQPAELAPIYVLLASEEASFVTGQIYGVTGGRFL